MYMTGEEYYNFIQKKIQQYGTECEIEKRYLVEISLKLKNDSINEETRDKLFKNYFQHFKKYIEIVDEYSEYGKKFIQLIESTETKES